MSTFKLKARPTFSFTAEIRNLDGEVLPLQVEARHMRKAALDDFVAALPGRADRDVIADILVGWKDVDAPFSIEAIDELLQEFECAAVVIWRDYLAAYQKAREKN